MCVRVTASGLQCHGGFSVIATLSDVDSAEWLAARLSRLHDGHLGLLPGFLLSQKTKENPACDEIRQEFCRTRFLLCRLL